MLAFIILDFLTKFDAFIAQGQLNNRLRLSIHGWSTLAGFQTALIYIKAKEKILLIESISIATLIKTLRKSEMKRKNNLSVVIGRT